MKNCLLARVVPRNSVINNVLCFIQESTQERNLINAQCAPKNSIKELPQNLSIQTKRSFLVIFAKRNSKEQKMLEFTKHMHMLLRRNTAAKTVHGSLIQEHTFSFIKPFIRVQTSAFHVATVGKHFL